MSDVTLMDSDLNKLVFSMKMGAKVITTVKENIIFSLVTNATAVVLTFAGNMTLLLAIVCDVGVMLLVTLNGMKLLSERTICSLENSTYINVASSSIAPMTKNTNQYNIQSQDNDDDIEIV